MKRLLTGLLLVAVLAGTSAAAVTKPERVLAVEWQAGGGKLRWVSPTTMRPVGTTVLNVGGAPADILATSPDGALAAIGGGENGRLRFVRLDGLRPAGLMWLGGASAFKGIWSTPDRLDIFVLGTNLGIWHKWRQGHQWSEGWSSLGSLWLTPPHVLSRGPGTIDAVAINSQSGLSHAQFRDGQWSSWQTDDDVCISRPFAVESLGKLQVFALGENRGVYHYVWEGEWTKPTPLDGVAITHPRAVAWPDGGIDVFVVGQDSTVYSRSRRGGDWREWTTHGGRAFSPPSIVAHDKVVELFVLGVDSAIWHAAIPVA